CRHGGRSLSKVIGAANHRCARHFDQGTRWQQTCPCRIGPLLTGVERFWAWRQFGMSWPCEHEHDNPNEFAHGHGVSWWVWRGSLLRSSRAITGSHERELARRRTGHQRLRASNAAIPQPISPTTEIATLIIARASTTAAIVSTINLMAAAS